MNDNVDVGRLLADSLAPELEVYRASTVQQACELLEELLWVDLAFLDLELPDGGADELLERFARWPDAIRVLLGNALFADGADDGSASGRGLKYRHLVHLVVDKPPALPVVHALKSMVLALPKA